MGIFDILSPLAKPATSLFNRAYENPAKAARPYLDQIPGVGQKYYSPYVNRGEQASQQAGDVYSRLSMDPQAFLQQIMAGYKPTEGYKFQSGQALKAANSAAAAGGYAGTDYDQMQRTELANQFANQDMQQYIQNILGLQGAGLQGLQRQGDTGFQASSGAADYFGNYFGNRGQAESSGRRFQSQGIQNLLSGLISAGGQIGGAAAGNPNGGKGWL